MESPHENCDIFPYQLLSAHIWTYLASTLYMGVSKNRGTPKWMVKIMENIIKMDDLGGKPTVFGNISYAEQLGCKLKIATVVTHGEVDPP